MYTKKNYNRRLNYQQNPVFKKKFHWLLSTFLVICIIFIATGITANAKSDTKQLYKYYQSYLVENGDTLLSIAYDMNADICTRAQIQECVTEMIAINSLDHNGTICYGNYILVPYYSDVYQ